jgi:hypothetical protein
VGFKEDADFARLLSMGAAGTAAVATYLRDQLGHEPIVLERHAMSNKIWQKKGKRLRVPDLLCVRCGRRIESRAKSKLGIVVSDSDTPGREWHAEGIRDDDLYAFARADTGSFPPAIGQPVFFEGGALRRALGHGARGARKARSQGSEVTFEWKSYVPERSGVFRGLDDQGCIVMERDDGSRAPPYRHWLDWPDRYLYLEVGDPILGGDTMVAGVVRPSGPLACPGPTWDAVTELESDDPVGVYVAVRAIGARSDRRAFHALERVAGQAQLDWRVRLEAQASLARLDPSPHTRPIAELALDSRQPIEVRMEAVFVLTDLANGEATRALAAVAALGDQTLEELRAAAVWGLGRGVHSRPDLVLPYAVDPSDLVGLHAIVALRRLPGDLLPILSAWLAADDRHAASAATILVRHQEVPTLLAVARSGTGSGRRWAVNALGRLPSEIVEARAGGHLTAELRDELLALWVVHRDWLRGDMHEGLRALSLQTILLDPAEPGLQD